MKKVLITSIGTGQRTQNSIHGEYRETVYSINNNKHKEKFVLKALHNEYKFDKICIVGTNRSIWDAVCQEFDGSDEYAINLMQLKEDGKLTEDNLTELKKQFKQKNIEGVFKVIKYGLNDDELWANFSKFIEITSEIETNDEVYLDITHSFRSLSLMSFIMLDFLKSVQNKNFKVKAIFYGMLEYTNDPDNEERCAPIIDLYPLFEISEWIKAIHAFKNYGRLDSVTNLIEKENTDVYRIFSDLSNMIAIANTQAIFITVKKLNSNIKQLEALFHPALREISKDIVKFANRLNKDKISQFQLELAKWFKENKNYALTYLALTESIVTKICEVSNLKETSKEDRNTAKDKLFNDPSFRDFKKLYKKIDTIRNSIAHQLVERQQMSSKDILGLDIHIKEAERLID